MAALFEFYSESRISNFSRSDHVLIQIQCRRYHQIIFIISGYKKEEETDTASWCRYLGARLNMLVFVGIGIRIIMITLVWDCLMIIMVIPILERRRFILRSLPRGLFVWFFLLNTPVNAENPSLENLSIPSEKIGYISTNKARSEFRLTMIWVWWALGAI